jgi:hypothetical protein
MKVQFVQSGGFVGSVKGCELDTATLPPDVGQELERLIRTSGISGSGESLSDPGRDLYQYDITIEEDNRRSSVVFDDATIPQSAKPLVSFLKKHLRPQALS